MGDFEIWESLDSNSEFEVSIWVLWIYMKMLLQVKTSSYFGSLNLYEEVALQIEFLFSSFWRSIQWDNEGDSAEMWSVEKRTHGNWRELKEALVRDRWWALYESYWSGSMRSISKRGADWRNNHAENSLRRLVINLRGLVGKTEFIFIVNLQEQRNPLFFFLFSTWRYFMLYLVQYLRACLLRFH